MTVYALGFGKQFRVVRRDLLTDLFYGYPTYFHQVFPELVQLRRWGSKPELVRFLNFDFRLLFNILLGA